MKTKIQNLFKYGRAALPRRRTTSRSSLPRRSFNISSATWAALPRKSFRLGLLFMLFAMAFSMTLGTYADTIEVISGFGTYPYLEDLDSRYIANPNGAFVARMGTSLVGIIRPIGGPLGTIYEDSLITIPCFGDNPIVDIAVAPDGTIIAVTATGGANGTGNTAFIDTNNNVTCVANAPAAIAPIGDVAVVQVNGDLVACQTGGSGSNPITLSVFDLSTFEQVSGVLLPAGTSPNGVLVVPPGGSPQSAKPAGIKPADVSSNDLSGYVLYGTAAGGGSSHDGILYKINGDGTGFQILHNFTFTATDGQFPKGNVIISGNTLYGTVAGGGQNGDGAVYSINTDETGYTNLYNFSYSNDGGVPSGDLLLVGDTLYGTADSGGGVNSSGNGTIFSVKTNGTGFSVLYTFSPLSTTTNASGLYTNIDGAQPNGGLILSSNVLVGTTTKGGANGYGTIFGLVLAAPVITTQPTNQTADLKDTVAFSVGVDNAGPFHYQWRHNGTNITDASKASNPYLVGGGFNDFVSSNQLGNYSVIVTNIYGSVTSSVAMLTPSILQNDSFANQNFTGWTLSPNASPSSVTFGYYDSASSGLWAAYLQESATNVMSYISQTVPTVIGQSYLLSFWLNTSKLSAGYSNEFLASWNGNTLFDQVNIPTGINAIPGANSSPTYGWMNLQYTVNSTDTNTVLQFGFQTGNPGDQFILTDINLLPVTIPPAPIPLNIQLSGNQVILNWTNSAFALQAAPIVTGTYTNIPGATNSPYTNPITGPQTFFRLIH